MSKTAPKPLPHRSELLRFLAYDPTTGHLTARIGSGKRRAGDRVDRPMTNGYRQVCVVGKKVYAHRVAWKIMTGEDPPILIDHKNNDHGDNSWTNLRECTHTNNLMNAKTPKDNTSGVKGVTFCAWTGRWRASIVYKRKVIRLGRFDTVEEAALVRRAAATALAGEFARHT